LSADHERVKQGKGMGMKILVVDDEMVSREKMKMIMSHFGQYEAVESGSDALEKFVHVHLF